MDSDDYTTDEGNKKRSREESEADPFLKSKRVIRTPTKVGKKGEDKLDKLIEMMNNLTKEVGGLTVELQEIRNEQRETIKEIKKLQAENREIKDENEELQKENKKIKEDMDKVGERLKRLEKEKRRNNIVITGLKIDTDKEDTLRDTMEKFIENGIKVIAGVKAAHKLGPNTCLVELEGKEDKKQIMQNKRILKDRSNEKIYINDDLTPEERDVARIIRGVAKEEKKNGKRVKIGYEKISIDDKWFKWNNKKQQLEDERGNSIGGSKN